MNIKKPNFNLKREKKGQSLIELTLVLMLLLTLLTGMVEFGNLLNQYINIVDGAREGARQGSNMDPFTRKKTASCPIPPCFNELNSDFYAGIDQYIEGNNIPLSKDRDPKATGAIAPIKLDPMAGDDVLISVFSIADGKVTRFPKGYDNGWSYYRDYEKLPIPVEKQNTTQFPGDSLNGRMVAGAPDTGMLLVEVFYHYHQLLKFFGILGLPDPIALSTYAIMPLSAAEPTSTPVP